MKDEMKAKLALPQRWLSSVSLDDSAAFFSHRERRKGFFQ